MYGSLLDIERKTINTSISKHVKLWVIAVCFDYRQKRLNSSYRISLWSRFRVVNSLRNLKIRWSNLRKSSKWKCWELIVLEDNKWDLGRRIDRWPKCFFYIIKSRLIKYKCISWEQNLIKRKQSLGGS